MLASGLRRCFNGRLLYRREWQVVCSRRGALGTLLLSTSLSTAACRSRGRGRAGAELSMPPVPEIASLAALVASKACWRGL